ncbi:hypothetical protein [Marinisporobacter balticus]|uniref:Uncharacterized protein n=1 Tax=Marinisporobacter balticus TaxID=2018667 RepID=A0A4R2KZ86_9FIRM|nr:hypothetical protein [Marinisporobacter balticus]TCO79424.1 hypothetical protein EV214_102143 [Marinisporobacter balticus]
MKNKGGRPKSNCDEELLQILEQYIKKHNNEKINLSRLAKETGIPRHRWDYSKKVKEIISKINNPIITVSEVCEELKTLPSVESLREQSSSNPKKVLEVYGACMRIINNLIDKAKGSYEFEKKISMLEKQMKDLKHENKLLQEQLKNQEKAMLELCIDSTSLKKRKDKNLKNNIISIDTKNVKKTVAITDEDIKNEFPWL